MRARLLSVAWLVAVWVALWGSLSAANVLSGVLVGTVLVMGFPPVRPRIPGRLRPLAALRFAAYFVVKLLEANLVVAWEVITPNNEAVTEGIVAVPLAGASDALITLVANAISLTPGTLTLDVHRNPTVLFIHVLHLHDIERVRRDVLELERRAMEAFGSDAALAATEQMGRTQSEVNR